MTSNNSHCLAKSAAPELPQSARVRPEFIRLPKSGTHCAWTGLSRSKLNELILPSPLNSHRPPVRSISLRNRNQVKAVRLVVLDSLLSFLHRLGADQMDEVAAVAPTTPPNFPPAQQPSGSVNISESARLNDGTAFKYSADSCPISKPAVLNGGGRKSLIIN